MFIFAKDYRVLSYQCYQWSTENGYIMCSEDLEDFGGKIKIKSTEYYCIYNNDNCHQQMRLFNNLNFF